MNWYKIQAKDEDGDGRTWVGRSDETLEALAQRAKDGDFIRLDELLYMDRGEVKEWADWDKSLVPTVFLNPASITSIMQFRGDPRTTPRK